MAYISDASTTKLASDERLMRTSETPDDVRLLIRNLRFLDLDLLPDYPNITTETFRVGKDVHVGQKDRIRPAEWVLYRLFEIWNEEETKTKLRPFFPALEPVQSIKLRTAFLQWLTQLKANGVLGRECALRRSMLDECKGKKIEEVLFHFSTAVLQMATEKKNRNGQIWPIALRLAISTSNSPEDQLWVQHLISAHQIALRSGLARRATFRHRMSLLADTVDDRKKSFELRRPQLEANIHEHESKLRSAGVDARNMKKQLRHDCAGDATWLSIILSGDSNQGRDGLIERPFNEILAEAKEGKTLSIEENQKSLLSKLDERVEAQRNRLEEWREFQTKVSKRNETLLVSKSPMKSPQKSPNKSRGPTPIKPPYDRRDASTKSTTIKRTRSIKTQGIARDLTPLLNARGRDQTSSNQTSEGDSLLNSQSHGITERLDNMANADEHDSPVAMRASRSRSPLKSTLPKPLHQRTGSDILLQGSPSAQIQSLSYSGKSLQQKDSSGDHIGSESVLRISGTHMLDSGGLASPDSHEQASGRTEIPSTRNSPAVEDSPSSGYQTLSERTLQTLQQCQVSMSSKYQRSHLGHSRNKSQPTQQALSHPSSEPFSWSTSESRRHSAAKNTSAQETPEKAGIPEAIPRFTPLASGSKSPSPTLKARSRSNSPIKTFADTPRSNPARSLAEDPNSVPFINPGNGVGEEPHTPPESLFSEDAEYASVFKSRSRLRHSPPASPVPTPSGDREQSHPFMTAARKKLEFE